MHIPFCETKELDILSFEEALASPNAKEYDSTRWLYVPDTYGDYRYILGTRGKNPLICIGINPSTAAPDQLDNTLKSVERIALHNGYDSFIMFNVYAQRATRPKDMEKNLNQLLHQENMKAFDYILRLSQEKRPHIWAAWGNIIENRQYLSLCLSDMIQIGKKYNAGWFTCGAISQKGHPHHPLYLKKDLPLDAFDIDRYLCQLQA